MTAYCWEGLNPGSLMVLAFDVESARRAAEIELLNLYGEDTEDDFAYDLDILYQEPDRSEDVEIPFLAWTAQ